MVTSSGLFGVANEGRQSREDTGHRRKVANVAIDHTEERNDRGLVGVIE
jgi:hypothetical protein